MEKEGLHVLLVRASVSALLFVSLYCTHSEEATCVSDIEIEAAGKAHDDTVECSCGCTRAQLTCEDLGGSLPFLSSITSMANANTNGYEMQRVIRVMPVKDDYAPLDLCESQ